MTTYEIRHFTPREFRCRCCGAGGATEGLALFLDWARRAWGGPVLVNSGFRCAAHNREVGGAARSRHLVGLAADVRPIEPELLPAFKGLFRALTAGMEGVELIEHPTFLHVGLPRASSPTLWTGGGVRVNVL